MGSEAPKKVIKVSELQQIQNIDRKDLMLVSDIEGESCISKKMTMGQLIDKISQAVIQSAALQQKIENVATSVAEEAAQEAVREKTVQIVKDNIGEIVDMVDGKPDDQVVFDGNN